MEIMKSSILQGPHIAAVTLAAYECKSTEFPEPPYPTEYVSFILYVWQLFKEYLKLLNRLYDIVWFGSVYA